MKQLFENNIYHKQIIGINKEALNRPTSRRSSCYSCQSSWAVKIMC